MSKKLKANDIINEELERLCAKKRELEDELRTMRTRRHNGMDDDRAEDIVEEIYRDILDIEKQIKILEDSLV